MMPPRFWSILLIVGILCAAMSYLPHLQPYFWFSIANIIAYSVYYTFMVWLAQRTASSKNKYLFTQVMLSSVFLKMFVALAVFGVYYKLQSPKGLFFLVPFFGIYVIYSIFGITFLNRLSKIKSPD
jgi:hypothetical protein